MLQGSTVITPAARYAGNPISSRARLPGCDHARRATVPGTLAREGLEYGLSANHTCRPPSRSRIVNDGAATTSFDPRVILADLGVHAVAQVERVHGGMDAAIWRVESERGRFALRLMRPEQVERSRLEVAAMRAARAAGVRTPQVIDLELWHGRPAMLLDWLPGSALIHALEAHPLHLWSLGVQFGRMQAAIHATPAPSELRQDESSWIRWARDESIAERLRALTPRTTALLHLDYHPLNVMSDGHTITGVIDWTNACAGDPRADFARTYTILRVEPWSPRPSLRIAAFRRLLAAAWRRGYEQAGGTLHDLAPFFAWAGMAMVHDLSPRVASPDHWFEARHIDQVRRWAQHWKQRAGIND
jgi:aminoglycoside phosphotransferase (APT) family kinase protein